MIAHAATAISGGEREMAVLFPVSLLWLHKGLLAVLMFSGLLGFWLGRELG